MGTELHNKRDSLLAALAERREPQAASTVDGQIRGSSASLADRLAAVRSRAAGPADEGSCPFTGWES